MNIKAGLNKDTPLELLLNDSICQAKNIIISNDLETILAENAIKTEFDLSVYGDIVGHIDCPTEIVLFFKNNKIIRYNSINKAIIDVDAKWKWCGGEVFGTYTYNVKNQLIVAISERNTDKEVPLKVINLNIEESNINEDIYNLYPNVPIANADIKLINGNSMAIGTYTFFIRYSINEKYKTNWFPIGDKIHLYNDNSIDNLKVIIDHTYQRQNGFELNDVNEANYKYHFDLFDLYNDDIDKCNKNIQLNIFINNIGNYNNFEIGYICNSKSGTNAYITNSYNLKETNTIILDGNDNLYNIDSLTVDNINAINVTSMCNYKNRLYIGGFKEQNRNKNLNYINTNGINIEVINENFDIRINTAINSYRKSFIPCTCYQFFIHYVWKNGTVSDGIIIDDSSTAVDEIIIDDTVNKIQKFYNIINEPVYYIGALPGNISVTIKNIPIVENAVGCFISCAKIEQSFIGQGLLFGKDKGTNNLDVSTGTEFRAYYPEFNILGGNTNITRCIKIGKLVEQLDTDVNNTKLYNLSYKDFNKDTIIVDKHTVVAPDSSNNYGREGYLSITTVSSHTINSTDVFYFVNYSFGEFINKYSNKTKLLKRISNIMLFKNTNNVNLDYTVGYQTFGSIYGTIKGGYIVSTTQSMPTFANANEEEQGSGVYARNFIYPIISQYPLYAKQINIPPEIIYYNYAIYENSTEELTSEVTSAIDIMLLKSNIKTNIKIKETQQLRNYIVQSSNLNSLFKLDISYYNYIEKIYQNYDKEKDIYITNKTIRRSDVIADESTDINWRYFRPENYKVITENKGVVKNVVGAGTYLLVHCEHSLFAFDVNNVMKTDDKDVQLTMPDVFDINYKEIFTAEQGFGGLHDNTSWTFNEHGYMFYDYSAKRFYRFDNNQLIYINNDINNFIKATDFNNVIFGYDKPNNRCLVGFKKDNNIVNITSYNYNINNWISEHDYKNVIDFATIKDKVYYITNKRTLATYVINIFNENINNDIVDSYIDVLFTDNNENRIKVLNYITYIVNKEYVDTYNELKLKVYTDTCITDWISLLEERKSVKDYKSPVYDYDKWNINYFRNIAKDIHNSNDIINRITGEFQEIPTIIKKGVDNALMVGKYFVVRFVFSNNKKQVQIKDIQTYFK